MNCKKEVTITSKKNNLVSLRQKKIIPRGSRSYSIIHKETPVNGFLITEGTFNGLWQDFRKEESGGDFSSSRQIVL